MTRLKPKITKKCEECGIPYQTSRIRQRYCSKKCVRENQRKEYDGKYYHKTPYYKLRWKILLRDNFKCQYCGNTAKDCRLCIDHIKAESKKGKSTEDNLITSCEYCNLGKGDVLLSAHDIAKIQALKAQ